MTRHRWRTLITASICVAACSLFAAPAPAAPVQKTAIARAALDVTPPRQPTLFAEPLVQTAPATPAEDLALSKALAVYAHRTNPDDFSSLTGFLSQYPNSGWAPALLTNLGLSYLHDGNFSLAIDAWKAAWQQGKGATDPRAHALVDRAVGQLARLYASLGQSQNLTALFAEIGNRRVTGSATEDVQDAREALTMAQRDHKHLYNCGPIALGILMLAQNPHDQRGNLLPFYPSGTAGTNLGELGKIGDKLGFSSRLVLRKPGQPVPIPSIVHWKAGHFATIVGEAIGRYHVEDPVFAGADLWVTQAALDTESSGYFLVPASKTMRTGWLTASSAAAAQIWGKGATNAVQPGDAGDPFAGGGPDGCPMCGYGIKAATVGLTLSDQPVGYTPPIGPAPTVAITYNQREDSQPANFSFYNVSQKWTLNWLAYVTDDPTNPGASVSRYLPGGGAYYYTGYNSSTGAFATESDDNSVLVLASANPVTYRRQLPDGSVNIYAQSDGNIAYPRHIFLSQVIDSQGNTLTLNYDSQMRLISLTDATGRQTTFSYNQPAQPLLVTQITDPFGRSATFTYDSAGRLSSITDILGLTSSFTYDANSLVNSLTPPYGTTNFAYTAPGSSGPPRFLQVTDPLGYHEREEWVEPAPGIPDTDPASTVPVGMPVTLENQYLEYRDSFHWDKNAYVLAGCTPTGGCDYTKAVDWHFAHVPNTSTKSTTIESIKNPLENRIWFNYPGQTAGYYAGTYNQPIATGRVLDDGTTQINQTAYGTTGFFQPTQEIDPIGRTTSFSYLNQIDLSAIYQQTASTVNTVLAQIGYNYTHRPVAYVDAAGQVTKQSYNAAGQLTSVTNPLNQTTTYHYNSTGDLTSIVNANGVTAATYTYDAFDRVATYADSQGWTAHYYYDAANRITKTTYPDGTADTYTYNNLDLASYQDRLGRIWTYTYDADRRLTAMTDSTGHQTHYAYNPDSTLTKLTDPRGKITQWAYDLEDRLISKTFNDNSTITYTYENTTSRLKSILDGRGETKQYSYDADNEVAGITYSNTWQPTPNISFAYDIYFPRLVSMTDGTGTTQYSYVPPGSNGAFQLLQEIPPLASSTITYAYDALGRPSSRTVMGAGAETFQYDALGRLTGDSNDLGAFTLAYLGATSQIASRSLTGSTLATTWSYLPNTGDRRLSGVSTTGLSSGQYSTFQYTTDAENEITGTTQTSDSTISYPPTGQQTASFNGLNQISSLQNPPPSSQTYGYNTDGDLNTDGTHSISWDAENRPVNITYPAQSGKVSKFTYDGLGRRITIAETPAGGGTAVTTSYIWCGMQPCQARNSAGTVTSEYYAEGEYVPGSPATSYYYGTDNLGSVRRVFYAGGAPTYDYDPYGNPLQTTAPVTDYGYAGMFLHQPSGLYLTWFRAYDPVSGRWLSRDPAGEFSGGLAGGADSSTGFGNQQSGLDYGSISLPKIPAVSSKVKVPAVVSLFDTTGLNLYAYVNGDPVNNVDPLGLISGGAAAAGAPSPNPNPGNPNGSGGCVQNASDDGTPGDNQRQNKQFRDIVKQLGLNQDQARQLHDEISGQNYGYHEILQIGQGMFGE